MIYVNKHNLEEDFYFIRRYNRGCIEGCDYRFIFSKEGIDVLTITLMDNSPSNNYNLFSINKEELLNLGSGHFDFRVDIPSDILGERIIIDRDLMYIELENSLNTNKDLGIYK